MLFAAPLLGIYVRTANDPDLTFYWSDVFFIWRKFSIYLLLFLVHNFFVAPQLVHRHKRWTYFSLGFLMVALFTVFQLTTSPKMRHRDFKGPNREMGLRLGHPRDAKERVEQPEDATFGEDRDFHDGPEFKDGPAPQEGDGLMEGPKPENEPDFMDGPKPKDGPFVIVEPDIMAILMLIMMFAANLGIKGYFRSSNDRRRLVALEKQNLEQQLEYLRFQINPHFFMNTLNNIHALIDIDPIKAQETIVELSKMMRYILYEGDRQGVPLTKEMDFIRNYISLMRLRYSDKVGISLNLPTEVPDRAIPPLILVSFIENAFKHGISYQHDSFIEVVVTVENDKMSFTCRNSKADVPNQEKGGVGLVNVRKRLDLLYPGEYELYFNDDAAIYTVKLIIPLKPLGETQNRKS